MNTRLQYLLPLIIILFIIFFTPAGLQARAEGEKVALPEEVQAILTRLFNRLNALPELPPAPPGSDPRLKSYQELARERNLSLMAAEGTLRSDEDQLRADLAALFPQFDFNADYSRSREEEDNFTRWLARFTVDQPLWDGQIWGEYKQQRAQVSYAQFFRDGVIQNLDFEVAEAYYNLVRYNQTIDENLRQVRQLNDQLRVIKEMLNAGNKTKADLLRAENAVLEEQSFLVGNADQAGLQLIQFNLMLHLPPDTGVSIHQLGKIELLLPELDSCLSRAYEERPDIKQNQALVRVAEAGVTLASQNFFPTAGFQGEYGWNYDDGESDSSERSWSVGATVSLPIFHSTRNWSLLAGARELERNARTGLEQVRDQAAAEVSSTITSITDAIAQIHLLHKNAEYAQSLWEVEEELYSRGTILTSDLYQSFNILLEVRLALINKVCDYLTLMSRLKREIGGGSIPPPLLSKGTVSITSLYSHGNIKKK